MDDDERFVARRGTRGEWHWQGQAPPESDPERPSRLARWRSALSERLRAAGQWWRARFSSLGSAAGRLGRPQRAQRPGSPEAATELTDDELPGWVPAPSPEAAAPAPRSASDVAPKQPAELPPREPLIKRWRENPPIRWSRVAPPRPKINLRAPELAAGSFRPTPIREDLLALLAVVAGLALASVIAVGAIVTVNALADGDSSGFVVRLTDSPKPTGTTSPSGSETPAASGARSSTSTSTPTPAPATTVVPTTATPNRPPTPAPTPAGLVTSPQGAVSVAYWANRLNAWWFDDLTERVANYEEGQDIPFIVRWDGIAGRTYWLHIIYDCQTPDTFGTIDYLSGVQDWSEQLKTAANGPGAVQPDGAIPVPDTPNFDPDDGNVAVFTLYGAKFPVLPLAPHPDYTCRVQRTQDLPIQAYGGPITFMASAHLGTATVYSSGEGASKASVPFGLHISVTRVGGASVMVDPSAIADVER